MKKWFDDITHAKERGEKVVYAFVSQSPFELLRSFGLNTFVFPEVQSLQCAVKQVAPKFIEKAEEVGYPSDVCGYVKVDVGLMEMGMQHPMGLIPKPDLILGGSTCNTWLKWAEVWHDYFDAPVVVIDQPLRFQDRAKYWGSETYKNDKAYILSQLQELIEVCEKLTGKKFDPDKLAEYESKWNRVADAWAPIPLFNKRRPSVFNAWEDGLNYMGAFQTSRGTDDCVPYLENVKKELDERVALGLYPLPDERFRVMIHFAPCWCSLKPYLDMFKKWKVGFAYGSYMNVFIQQHFRYDVSRPLDTMADRLLFQNDPRSPNSPLSSLEHIQWACREYSLDGVVLQGLKSCRLISAPMLDYRDNLQKAGIPTLFLEGDLVDARYFSEAQAKNRVDAFFEALENKRVRDSAK